jgi:lysophospholipase L1-like esterase
MATPDFIKTGFISVTGLRLPVFAPAILGLVFSLSSASATSDPFLQESGGQGIVSMEAENNHANVPLGSHSWQSPASPPAGYSGAGVMQSLPDNRTSITSNYAATSPRLDFDVQFNSIGTHYVWIRGLGPSGGSNSLHVGIDGQEVPTAEAINITHQVGYIWTNWGTATINVATTGVHTINVWMREDGTVFDKIVLTTDPAYVPTGNGPPESPTGTNANPVAMDDAFSVDENSANNNLAVLLDNGNGVDSDPDGDPLTVTAVGATDNGGAAIINGTNDGVDYTPAVNFVGIETFTYTVSDGNGGSDQATVTVTVNAVPNQDPVAKDDAFTVNFNSANNNLAVLLDNGNGVDSDPDGDPLTVTAVGATDNGGTAIINGTNDGVDYTPAVGFSGLETFTYTVSDGQGGSAQATVSVTVDTTPNQDPVAQDDAFSVDENSANNNLAVLLDNGNGADSDPDGDPLTVTAVGATDNGGTAVVNGASDGVDYTPAVGFTGIETFTYNVSDGQGGSAQATVTVTVNALPNQDPVAQDDAFNVAADSLNNNLAVLLDNGNGVDSDPDGDPLTVTEVGATDNGGTAIINGTNEGVDYTPAIGFIGLETFTYTVSDGQGGSAQATVSVTVNGGGFVQEVGGQGIVSMEAENYHDKIARGAHEWQQPASPDAGYSGVGVMQALPDSGTRYSTDYAANSPQMDYDVQFSSTGTHYVWIRGLGPKGASNSIHVGIDGQEVPTAEAINIQHQAGYVWTNWGGAFINVASTGLHTINVWMREDGTVVDKIVLTTDPGFTPTGFGPDESPDGGGAANQLPVAQDDAFNVVENTANNNLAVLLDNGNGADSDPDGDSLTVIAVGATDSGGTAVVNGSGDGVDYTPAVNFTGVETFTYTIDDGNGGTDQASVSVTVTATPNQDPVAQDDAFSVSKDSSANNLEVLLDNGSGVDSDPDGDPLTVTAVGATDNGGTAVINGTGDGVDYTPATGFNGVETFSYTISDGNGGSDQATVTVTVTVPGSGTGEFLQGTGGQGIVSMEAENYHAKIPRGVHDWLEPSNPDSGFSGTAVMQALPDNRTRYSSNYAANSPQMDYEVQFNSTGIHYVWIRGLGPGGGSNSLHVGIDGQEVPTAEDINLLHKSGYVWSDGVDTIDVSSTGVHTINVWMREDGVVVDKIVLTTDPAYTPTGAGPPESGRGLSCVVYPSVAITSPVTGHLQSSPHLAVETLTCLDDVTHSGWGVKFELDGGGTQFVYAEPFEATFLSASQAEHIVDVQVVDDLGVDVAGADTSDQVTSVGIGDYYVAIGDSITEGVGDDDPADDISLDGRNSGGGYEPVLNNLLTAARGYPHTVVDEGIAGDTSAGGLAALPGILANHPEAQRYLVKFGMNDARPWLPVPSGLGLSSGDPGYPGTYKANMQDIINLINGAGKEAVLAKINIALADSSDSPDLYPDPNTGARSLLILEFNAVVDELIAIPGNNITIAAPDFYTYFWTNYTAEYFDNIHPNGVGYQSMGNLWFLVLDP